MVEVVAAIVTYDSTAFIDSVNEMAIHVILVTTNNKIKKKLASGEARTRDLRIAHVHNV